MMSLGLAYDSSSDEDTTKHRQPPRKKRKLPALSDSLVVRAPVDDPALHQGRTRSTPFVEGQWAAYVYVPVIIEATSPLRALLAEILRTTHESVPALHSIPEDTVDAPRKRIELHVSLSRPIYLRAHQRAELIQSVKAIASRTPPITASFATIAELTNDERTRTFLTLEVGAGHDGFKALSGKLAPTLERLRQQTYYAQPRFHASFAWALLNRARDPAAKEEVPSKEMSDSQDHLFAAIPAFPPDLVSTLVTSYGSRLTSSKAGHFDVDRVCVRIGKDVTEWSLGGAV